MTKRSDTLAFAGVSFLGNPARRDDTAAPRRPPGRGEMVLTEREAGLKECCGPISAPSEYITPNCRASKCMAWRWTKEMREVDPATICPECEGTGYMPDDKGERGACPGCEGVGKQYHFERVGFCGLGGKPDIT